MVTKKFDKIANNIIQIQYKISTYKKSCLDPRTAVLVVITDGDLGDERSPTAAVVLLVGRMVAMAALDGLRLVRMRSRGRVRSCMAALGVQHRLHALVLVEV